MASTCPKPCGGLATSAVFIAIGVIQFLSGVVLLRSQHADLLSGPNFLTASSNIGIGCVIGTTASVWKNNKKKSTEKYIARRNVLAALFLTVVVVNVTSAVILILGEGNELLTLYLGSEDRIDSATFASEVLAGAYVTAVCSPIVCIVVAIVALSGSCFDCKESEKRKLKDDGITETRYDWSFDPTFAPTLSYVETPTSVTNSASDDSVFDEKPASLSDKRKYLLSNIPTPVESPQKGARVHNDSSWVQKRMHLYDNRLHSHCSSSGQISPRISTDFSALDYDELNHNIPRKSISSYGVSAMKSKSHGNISVQKLTLSETERDDQTESYRAEGSQQQYNRENKSKISTTKSKLKPTPLNKLRLLAGNTDQAGTSSDAISHSRSMNSVGYTPYRIPLRDSAFAKLNKETLEELKEKVRNMAINDSADDQEFEAQVPKIQSFDVVPPTSVRDMQTEDVPFSRIELVNGNPETVRSGRSKSSSELAKRDVSIDMEKLGRQRTDSSKYQKPGPSNLVNKRSASIQPIPTIEVNPISQEQKKDISGQKMSRKKSTTSLRLLKRMRTVTGLETVDYSDYIMDKDSLIGLSEEDLMARTFRIRSLRNEVAKKLKSETESPN